ncbi:maternal embryonic leucine zipper kinase-like [Hydractinia symbiolongicarpus]|uniref:maternal embryonic leucine zipper kinase-like n=1 Tax=Hydractinia symbiolongicarpus TaxID=13093 RepID=UPI00254D7635|nr:maternal embryonic leucine zipper kinase-like [Hydractinia symbiolongicarpus]
MPERIVSVFPPELDDYEDKNEKLGEGGFAEVYLAEHKQTGMRVAVKVMNKAMLENMGDLHRAYREIDAMKRLGCHQHICQLYQVVETDKDIFLVLEYISGGELFDYIVSREKLSEKESRSFFRQIVSAAAYIHSKGLAHRDLKPENMLLDSNNSIKIIDFGLSSNPKTNILQPLATCCGSPAYAAPELISGKSYFGPEADLWSLGIVLYGLLNGFLPFDVDDDEPTYALYEKIKLGDFEVPEWLSPGSVQILTRLLQTDAEKRITTKDLLQHSWLCEGYGAPVKWESTLSRESPDPKIVNELADYYEAVSDESMADLIKQYKYDSLTAHYYLLYKHRQKTPRPKVSFKTPTREKPQSRIPQTGRQCVSLSIDDIDVTPTRQSRSKSCSTDNDGIPYIDPSGVDYISPLRDTREKAASQVDNLNRLISLTPARPRPVFTNKKVGLAVGIMTPKFAKRIGKRVVNLMTPRKIPTSEQPRKIKGVYKVSTTSTKPAKIVRQEVETALATLRDSERLYGYEASKFKFKCKGRDERGAKLIFQLEICSVPGLDTIVGIRHSRLKGDAWAYKKTCDMILGMIKI